MAREGIPYTVGEARSLIADRGHAIDEYHRELMRFLIGEIDRLEKAQKGVAWALDRFEKQNGEVVAKAARELREILGLEGA